MSNFKTFVAMIQHLDTKMSGKLNKCYPQPIHGIHVKNILLNFDIIKSNTDHDQQALIGNELQRITNLI